jgi:hypothetical protein
VKQDRGELYISEEKRKYTNPPKIVLNCHNLSDAQISSIHKRGQVYISLCRSEGTGLGAVEAIVHGKSFIFSI